MQDKFLLVYDDTNEKSEVIRDVIGRKGFGDVIVKKRRLESYFADEMKALFPDAAFIYVKSPFELADFAVSVENMGDDTKILHFFSSFVISEPGKAALSFKKLPFIEKNYRVLSGGRPALLMFNGTKAYARFLKSAYQEKSTVAACEGIEGSFQIDGLVDIGRISNFIQVIAGNFDARYFNSLKGDEYTLVKSSTNIKKIKAEYSFYQLLPEDMRYWFVMPFNYREERDKASYTMERLHMTDLAIKWVHGSIDEGELADILDKYFYFFKCRHSKQVTAQEYDRLSRSLYVDKVK
ncbi:MAG: hypothetical protein IJU95_02390, partial [Treponema sp.]|nr:hypothetical protein [Treponema sp.]